MNKKSDILSIIYLKIINGLRICIKYFQKINIRFIVDTLKTMNYKKTLNFLIGLINYAMLINKNNIMK